MLDNRSYVNHRVEPGLVRIEEAAAQAFGA